jgi:hypothetical protein
VLFRSKNTILFTVVVLKFVPVITTASPGFEAIGAKELMVGWAFTICKTKQVIRYKVIFSFIQKYLCKNTFT